MVWKNPQINFEVVILFWYKIHDILDNLDRAT